MNMLQRAAYKKNIKMNMLLEETYKMIIKRIQKERFSTDRSFRLATETHSLRLSFSIQPMMTELAQVVEQLIIQLRLGA